MRAAALSKVRGCRYRTQLCNDGPRCSRPVCFFAHTACELRETDLVAVGPAASPKSARAAAAAGLPSVISLDKPGSGASTPRNPLDCRAGWGNSPPESEVSLSPANSFCLEAGLAPGSWASGTSAGFQGASLPLPRAPGGAITNPAGLRLAGSLPLPAPAERPLPASAIKLQAALAAAEAVASSGALAASEATSLHALLGPTRSADMQAYFAALVLGGQPMHA